MKALSKGRIDFMDVASYSICFALKRAFIQLKANSVLIFLFLVGMSSIQVYQEKQNPLFITKEIVPYVVESDRQVYNYCFRWNFDIVRESELTQFQWILKADNKKYFVSPWLKKEGRFNGMLTSNHFSQGSKEYEMCVSLPRYVQNVTLEGNSIFKVFILGIPWSNSYKHIVRF
jgi:hypothetical protein